MDYPNYIYSIFSFASFAFVTIPLYWHLESWNVGTCMYMIWTAIESLNLFVNSIVWANDAINRAPVWCDISTRIILAAAVAIPACSLCINRRLYHISVVKTVTVTRAQRRRTVLIDMLICLGIPLLQMVISYIPQGHRFNVVQEFGCYPAIYNVTVAYPLVFAWPLAISVLASVYCVLTVRAFWQRRLDFSTYLANSRNLTLGRYFRLMCLAGMELLFGIPLSAFSLWVSAKKGVVEPWLSWEDTHSNFSRVILVPSVVWRADKWSAISFEFTRWTMVLCAFIFIVFFGFADEARKNYRMAYYSMAKKLGYSTPAMEESLSNSYGQSRYTTKETMSGWDRSTAHRKARDSLFSVSVNLDTSICLNEPSPVLEKDEKAQNSTNLIVFSPTESTQGSSTLSLVTPSSPDYERPPHLFGPPALANVDRPQPVLEVSSLRRHSNCPSPVEPGPTSRRSSIEIV